MTYTSQETGIESGQPVEIYRFTLGATMFTYTSAEDDVVVSGTTYTAAPVSRRSISVDRNENNQSLRVELPGDNVFVRRYIGVVPGQRAELVIQRYHRNDGGTPEVITIFNGFVTAVTFENDGQKATIDALPIQAAVSRPMPRFKFTGLCNHVLYDEQCQVDENSSSFRFTGTVASVNSSGTTLTVTGAAAFNADPDFFVAGFIQSAAGDDFRAVLAQSGDDLVINLPFATDPTGSSVIVLAGCDHTIETCDSKFNNLTRFGGFNFIPALNPFESGIEIR